MSPLVSAWVARVSPHSGQRRPVAIRNGHIAGPGRAGISAASSAYATASAESKARRRLAAKARGGDDDDIVSMDAEVGLALGFRGFAG